MTVMENLQMGATVADPPFRRDLKRVCALFPLLEKRINQRGGTCPAASSRCSPSPAR